MSVITSRWRLWWRRSSRTSGRSGSPPTSASGASKRLSDPKSLLRDLSRRVVRSEIGEAFWTWWRAVIGPDILVFHTTVWLKPPPQRELRPLAPGRDLFRTGTVRAHHRLGGADALAAGERLCPCHPRFPPQWPACPFRRSQRRAHDVVAWAEACRRNPRRGCGGPCPRTRRCVSAPHAYRAQFGHEPEPRLADRYRHFDHEAPARRVRPRNFIVIIGPKTMNRSWWVRPLATCTVSLAVAVLTLATHATSRDRTTGVVLRGTESLLTHRWRGTDSNF